MTITNLRAQPAVALAGKPVALVPVGSPTGPDNTPRYYLTSAPGSSKLLTLATRALLNRTLEDCRLKTTPSGAQFTPDEPGLYECTLVNVAAVPFIPSWDGETGADTDDELTGALSYTINLRVVEQVTVSIGIQPDTASLAIYTYDDRVVSTGQASALGVTPTALTPAASSAKAKIAAVSNDVLTVLDEIATVTDQLALNFLIGFGSLYVSGDGTADVAAETVAGLAAIWDQHLAHASSYVTHGGVDAANTISAGDATTLGTACTLLNQARTKYEAHRVYTTGSVHGSADNTSTHVIDSGLPAATTLSTAANLWADIWLKFGKHGVDSTFHGVPSNSPIDGTLKQQLEKPRTTLQLIERSNQLKALFNGHIVRTNSAAGHAAADADNVIVIPISFASLDGVTAVVNAIADSINRHALNLKADGTAAASAYHESGGDPVTDPSARVQPRATAQNAESILLTAASCLRAMQAHALNTEVHGSKIWGSYGSSRWPLYARLNQAWADTVQASQPTPPPNSNGFAAIARLVYGFRLGALDLAKRLGCENAVQDPGRVEIAHGGGLRHLCDAGVAGRI